MKNNYNKLYIYTFNQLYIRKDNKILYSGNRKLNKRWKLFMLLLCSKGETLSDQILIRELDMDNNDTPRQSLRALVYRLRKEISVENEEEPYIYTDKGGYGFNPDSNYWLDCEHFANMIAKAQNTEIPFERANDLYQQTLNLYKGSFLNNHQLDNSHLLEKRNYYRDLYLKAVNDYISVLVKNNRLSEAIDLYETTLQLYPHNVELYLGLITTLKKDNKPGLAKIRAEEAFSFLRNSGMQIPEKLEKEVSNYFHADQEREPENVLANTCNDYDNVFECGPLTFSKIYNLEKRKSKREEKDIYLIHYKLDNNNSPEDLRKAEKILRMTLHQYLRSCDMITRWEPSHYLQLAVNLSEEKIEKILQRIESEYQEQYPPAEINLSYKYQKI